jgi:hypothetical protein
MARRLVLPLLLLAAPALRAQPHAQQTFQVAPLDECTKLAELPAADLYLLRDHAQLRLSKRRRERELQSFIAFKQNPSNDTINAAIWNSSRWAYKCTGTLRPIAVSYQSHSTSTIDQRDRGLGRGPHPTAAIAADSTTAAGRWRTCRGSTTS